jgi:uncharacterized RDD family membrane protein YckC
MKPKFQPDIEADPNVAERQMVDPEAYDASEQEFAASLEAEPRFVVEEPQAATQASTVRETISSEERSTLPDVPCQPSTTQGQPTETPSPNSDAWRQEVAARVTRYRSRRRPPAPRYPSLQLKFEPTDEHEGSSHQVPEAIEPAPVSRLAVATARAFAHPTMPPAAAPQAPDGGAKVIEFPRPPVPPPAWDELAEPLFDRPRIMEVPEVLPPPPALGGILMETPEEPIPQRRPGFEVPLDTPAKARRLAAAAFDLLLVVVAFAGFAYIFLRMTGIVPALRQTLGVSAALIVFFWAGYQYLLLVCTGSTPGLRVARLRLTRFDGTPVPRNLRRWRVATSLLSGFSLALGYAWCFFDEDELCWHDRITRTYLALRPRPQPR